MRNAIVLAFLIATTACVPLPHTTLPGPVLSARTLDTTVAVGEADDRRTLAVQVQTCRARLETSIRRETNERVNLQRRRAMLVAGVGGASSLVTWFIVRESVRHGTNGLDAGIVLTLLGGAAVHMLQASMLPTIPPDQTYAHEREWTNVIAAVETWETTARDLASATQNAAGQPARSAPALTSVWRHADNALRSTLATCLA